MHRGYHEAAIDGKGRVKIPQKMREFDDGEGVWTSFYLAPGPDHSIAFYTPRRWKQIVPRFSGPLPLSPAETRKFERLFLSRVSYAKCDQQGRLVVPPALVGHGRLSLGGKVVWLGANDRLELWGAEAWKEYLRKEEGSFDELYDKVADYIAQGAASGPDQPTGQADGPDTEGEEDQGGGAGQ